MHIWKFGQNCGVKKLQQITFFAFLNLGCMYLFGWTINDFCTIRILVQNSFNLDHVFTPDRCINERMDRRRTNRRTDGLTALIRSAASFDIDGLIIKERHFPRDSKLMYKSASGCMEHVNIFQVSNINSTLKNLREKNFWVYGFDAKGKKDFTDIKWEGNNILLFGSEGFGMRQHTGKYADFFVKININEEIESLNISNSAAIVFHHLSYIKKKS